MHSIRQSNSTLLSSTIELHTSFWNRLNGEAPENKFHFDTAPSQDFVSRRTMQARGDVFATISKFINKKAVIKICGAGSVALLAPR